MSRQRLSLLGCAILFTLTQPLTSSASPSKAIEISRLDYSNPALMALRREVHTNLESLRQGKQLSIRWRMYRLKKNDNFFNVMAKTMQNHDTLSSVNRLASLFDTDPGDVWYIPNIRGIAVYGKIDELAAKYKIEPSLIQQVPKQKGLWFLPGAKFDLAEKNFFELKAFIRPVAGAISSVFGRRKDPFGNKKKFHKGVDIACPVGTPVKASASGKVVFVGTKTGYGKTVILEHQNGYQTLYAHLSKPTVKSNDRVSQGAQIALSGNSGRTTGPHLHFEVRRKGRPERPMVH